MLPLPVPHRTQATRLCRSCLRVLERRRCWSSLSEASASPALAQAGQWTLIASSPSAASYAQQLQHTSSSALRDHTLLAGARTPPHAASDSSGAFFTPSYYARLSLHPLCYASSPLAPPTPAAPPDRARLFPRSKRAPPPASSRILSTSRACRPTRARTGTASERRETQTGTQRTGW